MAGRCFMKISLPPTPDQILARAFVRGIVEACASRDTPCDPRLRRFRDLQRVEAGGEARAHDTPRLMRLILAEIDNALSDP